MSDRIVVIKGNDTDWNNQPFLKVFIRSESIDLSDFKAVFCLCGITKVYNNLSDGYFIVNFNAQETAAMTVGDHNGVLKLVDTSDRIATIESEIPFTFTSFVHGNSIATNPFEMTFNVEQGGENILNFDIKSGSIDWGNLGGNINNQLDLIERLDAKQNIISDLEEIRSGAALGATSVQSVTTGEENGTVSVDGSDVAVKGLGSAAFTDSTSYDAAGSASAAETSAKNYAKSYADGLAPNYATAAQGEKADTAVQTIQTGTDNGTISVDGTDVAVKGLGSAAYTSSSDYDAAGAASTAETNAKNYADGLATNYATAAQGLLADSALQPSDVVNDVVSTDTDKPLSANMGKSLQDQVDNLKARGRFLALWNCATGLAQTNPPTGTYEYKAGDYFIVGTVAHGNDPNYRPTGSSYTTGVASTVVETADVDVDDVYYYDGTNWALQINTQKTVSFGNIAGSPYDNSNLSSALNDKQDALVEGTGIDIDSTTNTISNSGVRSVSSGSTNGTISVNTGGTAAEVAVAGLGSAAYTSSSDYATSAQGTKADSAIQSVATGSANGTISVDGTDVSVKGLDSAAYTPSTDYATSAQGTKADTAVQPGDLATVATTGAYSDLSGTPTIPTVNNPTITLTQGGVTKGSFTLNQSSGDTIDLDSGGSGGATDLSDIAVAGDNITFTGGGVAQNFTVVGSPTISSNYVASGFSGSNYLSLTSPLNGKTVNSFELVLSYNLLNASYSEGNTTKCLYETSSNSGASVRLSLVDGYLRMRISSDGSTAMVDVTSPTRTADANTKYWAKITYDNVSGYALYSSTDGNNWTLLGSSATTTAPNTNAADILIGQNYGLGNGVAWPGEVYLLDWSMKLNGAVVWQAIDLHSKTTINANSILLTDIATAGKNISLTPAGYTPNYTVVGSPTIVDGIASGFSDLNYIMVPLNITSYTQAELIIRVKRDSTTGYHWAFTYSTISGRQIGFDASGHLFMNGTGGGTVVYSTSSYMWIKLVCTNGGNTWTLYGLPDGGYTLDTLPTAGWTQAATRTQSNPFGGYLILGGNTGTTFQGYIDLNNAELIVDGVVAWRSVLTSAKKEIRSGFYGTCSTGISTAAKVVVCSDFVLKAGAKVDVKFDYSNYASSPTLNVNGTGDIAIKSYGTTAVSGYSWQPGEIVPFIYDGTYWYMLRSAPATTTYFGPTKLSLMMTSSVQTSASTPYALYQTVYNMLASYSPYSSQSTYAVGDRVLRDYNAWECNTAITTAETWNSAHWTKLDPIQKQIDDKIGDIETLLAQV